MGLDFPPVNPTDQLIRKIYHPKYGRAEYDRERQAFIESVGMRCLRFTNDEVYGNLQGVWERITQEIWELW
jgi:very-short-patch-repair endonuclease